MGLMPVRSFRRGTLESCLAIDLTWWPGILDGLERAKYPMDRNPVVRQATGPLGGALRVETLGAPLSFLPAAYSGADTLCGHPSVRPSDS